MKNMMLNHNKLISAIQHYLSIADFAFAEFELNKEIALDSKIPVNYTGKVRINIGYDTEALVFIYFKVDKTVSFLVQGRDVALGGTVATTLINMVKRG